MLRFLRFIKHFAFAFEVLALITCSLARNFRACHSISLRVVVLCALVARNGHGRSMRLDDLHFKLSRFVRVIHLIQKHEEFGTDMVPSIFAHASCRVTLSSIASHFNHLPGVITSERASHFLAVNANLRSFARYTARTKRGTIIVSASAAISRGAGVLFAGHAQ